MNCFYFYFCIQLNTSGEKATMQHDMLRNPIPDEESDSEDSEDQDYLDFVSRTLPEASDSDDADYAFELNDDETSDTDSQSSVATNEFSDDDEKQPHPSVEVDSITNLFTIQCK